jgi:phage tail sheath protein FI
VVGALLATALGEAGSLHATTSSRAGWYVLTGCGVVVLVIGQVVTTQWAHDTADKTAHLLNPEYLEHRIR